MANCKVCGIRLTDDNRYSAGKNKRRYCKKCFCDAKRMRYREDHPKKPLLKDNVTRQWCHATIGHHKHGGFDLDFSIDELEDVAKTTTHCPICGVPLLWGRGYGNHANRPTLDRYDNRSGHETGHDHVWIICAKCNRTKSDRSMSDFVAYCKRVVDTFGGECQ